MATRLYLTLESAPVSVTPDGGWEYTTTPFTGKLGRTTRTESVASHSETESSVAVDKDYLIGQFVSDTLPAGQISGTVKGQIIAAAASDNDQDTQLVIRVVSGDGSTVRGTLLAFDTSALASEWVHTGFGDNRKMPKGWTGSGTSLSAVTAQSGDRIVVEVGCRSHATGGGSGGGLFLYFGADNTDVDLPENETDQDTTKNPWLEFSQNLFTFSETVTLTSNATTSQAGPIGAAASVSLSVASQVASPGGKVYAGSATLSNASSLAASGDVVRIFTESVNLRALIDLDTLGYGTRSGAYPTDTRDLGGVAAGATNENQLEWWYFIRWIFNSTAETIYLTDRHTDVPSQTVAGINATWVSADLEVGPLEQALQNVLSVSWVSFANLDYYWVSRASNIRDSSVTVAIGVLHNDTVVGSWKVYEGRADDAMLGRRAQITLKPHDTPWGKQVPWQKIGLNCFNVFKDPLTCQYAGGDTTCLKTFTDCSSKSNTSRFNGFRFLPKPNEEFFWGNRSE